MELGEKLKNARLGAGLSQRQLCGEEITRNMLSRIENGAARPSMDTLRYLAARLGKPVSFFLEEETVCSPNQEVMERARKSWQDGDWEATLAALEDFREPDAVYSGEQQTLLALALIGAAENALQEERNRYALELLGKAEDCQVPYFAGELERRRLLVLAEASGKAGACARLPSLDGELLLRARSALETGDGARAGELLEAAEDKSAPMWNFLRGEAHAMQGQYAEAARCYHRAEAAYPEITVPKLEQCYRELGDYKRAYEYACRQRK